MSEHQKEISVFVDESGSFDASSVPSRYYIVCLVFHDQDCPIDAAIAELGRQLENLGIASDHCIHAGPLIRREQEYVTLLREDRRQIFARMMSFIRQTDIQYRCFVVDKKFITTPEGIHDDLLQQMLGFLLRNAHILGSYDRLKIYYDNGQDRVKQLLQEAFAFLSSRTEFVPKVAPERYRLFQAADLLCTLELARVKLENEHRISESEKQFFVGIQNLRKRYLKPILRKLWA